jgi:hypothetical protein
MKLLPSHQQDKELLSSNNVVVNMAEALGRYRITLFVIANLKGLSSEILAT